MRRPIIGWEKPAPAPNQQFNDYLSSRNGRLFFEDLDLAQLVMGGGMDQGAGRALGSPLELIYLPMIRTKITRLQQVFAEAIGDTNYAGRFHYAYTSKSNATEEVVRTALGVGTHYEISSWIDVEIVRLMKARGLLKPEQMLVCNGFKASGSRYAGEIIKFQHEHPNTIAVVEDLNEVMPLIEAGQRLPVGLRQKSYGKHTDMAEMENANSRFGMSLGDLWEAADRIAAAPHLELKLYHAMLGSQITDEAGFVERLKPPMEIYAHLRHKFPSLSIFDFGGGVPAGLTLDFNFDYRRFARLLLITLQEVCGRFNVPVPDVMGEFGRYSVSEHGAHLFKVITAKDNGSPYPWYIIDGSIMSSMPDVWALDEHFIVLPLNHLDKPFRRVQLGGITCDSDDVYPPHVSTAPLYLPVVTDELYIGFFSIGAYQEMLGGSGGAKHCVIPEANELIVDRDAHGQYTFELWPGQDPSRVLSNLGYKAPAQH
jgi:arginine decarboxylase